MFRAYAKLIVILIVLLSAITTASISLGDVFPSKWTFIVTRVACITGCRERAYENFDTLLIDYDRGMEILIESESWFYARYVSPNGLYILLQWAFVQGQGSDGFRFYSLTSLRDSESVFREHVISRHILSRHNYHSRWSSNSQFFYVPIDQNLFRYNVNLLRFEKVFTGMSFIMEYVLSQNEDFALIMLENGDVYRQNLLSFDAPTLLVSNADPSIPIAYADNEQVAVFQEHNVVILDVITGNIIQSTEIIDDVQNLAWSPDGKWLTIVTTVQSEYGQVNYYIPPQILNLHVETNRIYPLHLENMPSSYSVSWSSDSRYLAVGVRFFYPVSRELLYITDAMGENRQLLTTDGYHSSSYWMPDRPVLLYSQGGGYQSFVPHGIFAVDVSEDILTPLFLSDGEWGRISDFLGDEIVYWRNVGGQDRIAVLNIVTGDIRDLSSPLYNIFTYSLWEN